MRSESIPKYFKATLTASLLALASATGCGMLGQKSLPALPGGGAGGAANGCLNDSVDLVGRYLRGEISQTQWKTSFDCVNQSLGFFTEFVRGSDSSSYSQGDMYNLITTFLITNREVRPELMGGAFSLKAGLFGGTDMEFTKDEIEVLKRSLTALQEITGELIPYLRVRQSSSPSNEELLAMARAFEQAGNRIADFINTLPVGSLSSRAIDSLLEELTHTLDLPGYEGVGNKVFLAKWLMFNTRRDAIENRDWAELFSSALGLGGMALAVKTSLGDDPEAPRGKLMNRILEDSQFRSLVWSLAQMARPYIERSLARHQGLAPLPLYDHIIDELPESMIGSVPRRVMKSAIRPLIRKLMQSSTQAGVDAGVIDTLYGLVGEVVEDLNTLDRMYEKQGLDRESLNRNQLTQALTSFENSTGSNAEKTRIRNIRTKLLTYSPLFRRRPGPKGDLYAIKFGPGVGYSHFQNRLVLMLDRVGRHLQKVYGTGGTHFVDTDLNAFFKDFGDILLTSRLFDTTIPNFAQKRLQDMDLFTPASDGNGEGSLVEFVNYAMILISSSHLTAQMRDEITPACDSGLGEDHMGWTKISAACFRSQFHARMDYWIAQDFPRLASYWNTLSPDQKRKAAVFLEHGSRRNGYTEEDFTKFDFGAVSVILYYVESMFGRFDADMTEHLARNEIDQAYPVFKNLIKKTAKAKGLNTGSDFLLKGIFTYIVKYQEMPATPLNASTLAKLATWMATYALPITSYDTDRYGIFSVVCNIAVPENPAQAPANAVVCAP